MASVYTINTGNTLNIHTAFKTLLPRSLCKDVSKVEDCDVILAFCPVISRVGTDIEAALQDIPEGKPLALVVLHQTIDSNYIVPDTRRFLKRADAISVDCLFTDDGLMGCPRNDDAVQAVAEFLGQHRKHSHNHSDGHSLVLLCFALLVLFVAIYPQNTSNISDETTITNMSNNTNRIKELELKMQQEKEERMEEVSSLKKEVQQLRDSLAQHIKDCPAIQNSEQASYIWQGLNSIFSWVQAGPEKQEDKSALSEPSETSETGALNETTEEGKNDETEAKQASEKEATSLERSNEGIRPIDSSNHYDNVTASDSKDGS